MRIWFLWSVFLTLGFAHNHVSFSALEVVKGETLLVKAKLSADHEPISLCFEKRCFSFMPHPKGGMYLLLPVHYYTEAKHYPLFYNAIIEGRLRREEIAQLTVMDGDYKSETLKVAPKKVTLSAKSLARTENERALLQKIYRKSTLEWLPKRPFKMPLYSKITSQFGNARLFNKSLQGYHSGVDFRARKPVRIRSVAKAKVVLVQELFYAGRCVILDHGNGIFSTYAHLSKFGVRVGDSVNRGQVIGLSGRTGRITAPHLHFSMKIDGVTVNPLQLIELINQNLF